MDFGWINLWNGCLVMLMLAPNLLHMLKSKGQGPEPHLPRGLMIAEQAGRFGCMAFMVLPLFVGKFGFSGVPGLALYALGNGALLLAYWGFWAAYRRRKTLSRAMVLALLPTAIFLLTGCLLRHGALVAAALLFGYAHVQITVLTHRVP